MDYPWAVPGAWVVCVVTDDPDSPLLLELIQKYRLPMPEVGKKYQIYDVQRHPTQRDRIGLRLVGHSQLIVYDIVCFRPLVDEDAKMFEAMLKDIPAEETEDA